MTNSTKIFRRGLIGGLLGLALVAFGLYGLGTARAQTFNDGGPGCSVADIFPFTRAFNVSGNKASTVVRVSGPASCRETVSLASWNAAFGSSSFSSQQRFFMGKTYTNLGPGQHTLTIGVDNSCAYQLDVVLGSNQKNGSGGFLYSPAVLMGFSQVQAGVCRKPMPTPPKPTPPAQTTNNVCAGNTTNTNSGTAAQGGNCSTNTTIVQNSTNMSSGSSTSSSANSSSSSTVNGAANQVSAANTTNANESAGAAQGGEGSASTAVTESAAPTTLVNTGPGSLASLGALFTGATVLGTLGYQRLLRRKLA